MRKGITLFMVLPVVLLMLFSFASAQALSKPTEVKTFYGVSYSTNKIKLKWERKTDSTGYIIYKKTGASYKKYKTITKNKTVSYVDSRTKSNIANYYKIKSYKKYKGKTYYSNISKSISVLPKSAKYNNAEIFTFDVSSETIKLQETGKVENVVIESQYGGHVFSDAIVWTKNNNNISFSKNGNYKGVKEGKTIIQGRTHNGIVCSKTVTVHGQLDPITYTGYGDDVIDIDNPFDETVFKISGGKKDEYFSVIGYDSNNQMTEVGVFALDYYSGKVYDSGDSKTTELEINASSSWKVQVCPVTATRTISKGKSISGRGDDVIRIKGKCKRAVISGGSADCYFAVCTYDKRQMVDNLVLELDSYYGTVKITDNPTIITVSTEGKWNITLY